MRIHLLVRTAIAGLCTTALVAVPALSSTSTAQTAERASAAMPTITAKVTSRGVSLHGTAGLHAGRARLVVKGRGDNTATFGTLKDGYTWPAFAKDLRAGFVKNDTKAIKRVYARTVAIGGLAPGSTGTIVFPHPGRYFAFTFGQRGPSKPSMFTVGSARKSRAPRVDGKIIAKDGPGWSGSSQLPAKGTFLFKNAATGPVLHFVDLQQVKEGTTVDQVLASFQGPETQGPPDWALQGHLSADVLSNGRSMTVNYDLPPGQYVVLCFMPDPKMHGMPHALMGMIRMIHVV